MKKELKAFDNDSRELKGVVTKKFSEFAKLGMHQEFFCRIHIKDRLLMFCHQDCLVDVVMGGAESIKFQRVLEHLTNCKCCEQIAEYGIVRID